MKRSIIRRETLIFLAFLTLTVLMTWPWVIHLRDASAGRGDPYAIAYYMWWDYHQTFHDPLNLFHSTVLYPYKYTLAFTESAYGVSLLFFPLFALGFKPFGENVNRLGRRRLDCGNRFLFHPIPFPTSSAPALDLHWLDPTAD
jgi:Zn-dependent protease